MVLRGVFAGLVLTLVATLGGPSALGQDKVVGAIWEIKFEAKDPKNVIVRKFRATPDGKVWNMPEKGKPRVIGKWSGDENNTKMEVSGTMGPNGKFELVMVSRNPPAWQGEFENEEGMKRPIKVRLIKD